MAKARARAESATTLNDMYFNVFILNLVFIFNNSFSSVWKKLTALSAYSVKVGRLSESLVYTLNSQFNVDSRRTA